ncbi:protein of unknown function [Cupriavidus taiwanensis]|nr:protein of unknown function [Cupriavidus taiwanensis]
MRRRGTLPQERLLDNTGQKPVPAVFQAWRPHARRLLSGNGTLTSRIRNFERRLIVNVHIATAFTNCKTPNEILANNF